MTDNRATPKNGPESTFVFIEANGEIFDDWTDYHVSNDVLAPVNEFGFHVPLVSNVVTAATFQRALRKGSRCRIYVKTPAAKKPVLVMAGIIDQFRFDEDRNKGAILSVDGRDHMAPIVDSDLLQRFTLEDVTFRDLVYKILVDAPKGRSRGYFEKADIQISNDANRVLMTGKPVGGVVLSKDAPPALETLKVDQAEPHPGETVYQFLHRHAMRFGLLVWGTCDGKIVFGRPRYDQPSSYRLEMRAGNRGVENNVKHFARVDSVRHRASEIHVFGKSLGHNAFASPTHVLVRDEEVEDLGFYKPMVVHDNNARSNDEATQRAKYEKSRRSQTGDVVHALVNGYDQETGTVYATDTMADVAWDKGDVHDTRYVVRRSFTRSRGAGTEATLDLIPKNSIALGTVQYVTSLTPKEVAFVQKAAAATPEVPFMKKLNLGP